jgi:processive 1,2-diacylglycerol beta-glucosyltransferase
MNTEGPGKRLLVMTSATGAGHDTHARAAREWCARIYGDAVEVRIEHVLEDSHAVLRAGVDFYNFIQRRAPWVHHGYYQLVEGLDLLNDGTVGLGRAYYRGLLESFRPDAILSVHDCLNRGYFELAAEVLGPRVRCATYCAEFRGGYGFSKNWINRRTGAFFARTEAAVRETAAARLPGERVRVAGHWAPPAFYAPPAGGEDRAAYVRDVLGLEAGRFTVLLSTGGAGAQNHRALLTALGRVGGGVQAVALCGRQADDGVRAALEAWAVRTCDFPVRALGFTPEMPMLYQVCSAVVARAGATTAGEALLCGCPVIFNALGGWMPQEIPTWRYFRDGGVGTRVRRPDELTSVVGEWIRRPELYTALRSRMAGLRDGRTPEAALRWLLGNGISTTESTG